MKHFAQKFYYYFSYLLETFFFFKQTIPEHCKNYLWKSVNKSWDNTHFQRDWSIQGLQKHIAHHFLTCHYSWKETQKHNEKQY